MSIFDENILKDEEIRAGFNPGEPDDDTFFLGENEYPGDISEFEFKEEIPVQIEEVSDIPDATIIGAAGGNVWDEFNDEEVNQTDDTAKLDEIFEEEIVEEPVIEEPIVVKQEPEIIEPVNAEQEIFQQEEIIEPEVDDTPLTNVIAANTDDEITVDDEFKKFLQQQLDKSKTKKESEYLYEAEDENAVVLDNEGDFTPVEETEDTELIQFDNITAKSPSELSAQMNNSYEEESKFNHSDDNDKTIKEEDKSKRKRDAFPILLVASIFAGFLFLGVAGYFIYSKIMMKGVDNTEQTDTAHKSSDAKKEAEHSKPKEEPKVEKPDVSKVDTITVEKNDSANAIKEFEKSAEKKSDENIDKAVVKELPDNKVDEKPKVIAKVDEQFETKKPIIKAEKPISKPKVKPLPKEFKNKDITAKPKQEKSVEKSIETKKKDVDIATSKPAPEIYNKSATSTLKDVGGVGEYTIQIYSSPSKEDAEQWLKRLQQKNVSDGFISTQMIRDRLFYRVRFGKFRTKEEARSAAIRLGFTQSWIDRVK